MKIHAEREDTNMPVNHKNLLPLSRTKSGSTPALLGVWTNELGSQMTITNFDGQTLSGSYKSAVSEGGTSVTGPLAGTVAGDAIAFTVNWDASFSSVTAWTGLLLGGDGQLVIYALWQLATTPEQSTNFWQSINAGADIFVQQDSE